MAAMLGLCGRLQFDIEQTYLPLLRDNERYKAVNAAERQILVIM
jgi:hypothetical protein